MKFGFNGLTLLLSFFGASPLLAEGNIDTARLSMPIPDYVENIPEVITERLDYMYENWVDENRDIHEYVDSSYMKRQQYRDTVKNTADSVYIQRLDAIRSAIPLSYNDIVKDFLELYLVDRRYQVANMLGLAEYYFPMIEQELDAQNMPHELKYMTVIESALNARAYSRAGAAGLWQFIYSTGKMYNLQITSYIDERRDPFKATKAAVNYLKDMYNIYEDWILVIAAYNCGPGNVNKAIRRAGGVRNYWDIYYYLPRETRGYVPAFIAAAYTFQYHDLYGIKPIESNMPTLCDTLMINDLLSLEQVAAKINLSKEQLRDLNPQYRVDVIPAGAGKSYALRLPYSDVSKFIDNQDSIFAYNRSKYFNDADKTADPNRRIKVTGGPGSIDGRTKLIHTVRSGEVPGAIAMRYGVRLVDLRYWNNLNSRYTIRAGQRLAIYVPTSKASKYSSTAKVSGVVSNQTSAPKVTEADKNGFATYTVRKGDSLWIIARRFPGVSATDIQRWNGLGSRAVLKPGQKLKVKIE